jgi:hypothetical protein
MQKNQKGKGRVERNTKKEREKSSAEGWIERHVQRDKKIKKSW